MDSKTKRMIMIGVAIIAVIIYFLFLEKYASRQIDNATITITEKNWSTYMNNAQNPTNLEDVRIETVRVGDKVEIVTTMMRIYGTVKHISKDSVMLELTESMSLTGAVDKGTKNVTIKKGEEVTLNTLTMDAGVNVFIKY